MPFQRPPALMDKMPSSEENWLGRLFDESGQELLRFLARRLGSETDAEDLAQEVYLRLMRVQNVSRIRNRRAFALRVAANVAHEWRLLARNQRPHSSDGLEDQVSATQGPLEFALQAQQMQRLGQALGTLSPVTRAVVLLHKRDGLTLAQIAARVGYSVPMVRRYLALGLLLCQEALTRSRENGRP